MVFATLRCMMTGDHRQQVGQQGERRAERFLRSLGYAIVERNYRTSRGEIDLVAKDKDTLVFVEVRTRRRDGFGGPLASVGRQKQRQISNTALHYLTHSGLRDRTARFDVIGIVGEGKRADLTHVKAAFEFAA